MLSAINIGEENYREALVSLEKAHALDPDDTEVIFQTRSIHYRMGDPVMCANSTACSISVRARATCRRSTTALSKFSPGIISRRKTTRAPKRYCAPCPTALAPTSKPMRGGAVIKLGDYEEAVRRFERLPGRRRRPLHPLPGLRQIGHTERARGILAGLVANETYRSRARRDPLLSGPARQIEEEAKAKSGETSN
jgi:hypothetical protein